MSVARLAELGAPRHLKVRGPHPVLSFEPCEDPGCVVFEDGTGSSCRRLACPSCGCGGTNLSTLQLSRIPFGGTVSCTCGHTWVHGGMAIYVLACAQTAECRCPDACECDHGN
jgi:hypothetical protein